MKPNQFSNLSTHVVLSYDPRRRTHHSYNIEEVVGSTPEEIVRGRIKGWYGNNQLQELSIFPCPDNICSYHVKATIRDTFPSGKYNESSYHWGIMENTTHSEIPELPIKARTQKMSKRPKWKNKEIPQ